MNDAMQQLRCHDTWANEVIFIKQDKTVHGSVGVLYVEIFNVIVEPNETC